MRLRSLLICSLVSLPLALAACSSSAAGSPSTPPTATATATATAVATATPSGPPGAISGDELMYPADSMPSLAIYAISTTDNHTFFFTQTAGQLSYKITGVTAGTYYVIAYLANPPTGNFKALVGTHRRFRAPCPAHWSATTIH